MKNGANGSSDTDDRYGDPNSDALASFRSSVRREVLAGDFESDHSRRNGSLTGLDGLPGIPPPSVLDVPPPHIPAPSLSDVGRVSDLGRVSEMGHLPSVSHLDESVFDPPSWLDNPAMPLADHPLLRGLLLELPNKGPMPSADWLDRWFEAARSILELLYAQSSR
ncbi:hypothetical protein GCM10009682_05040 [Luedemannella flava]|uniref:Uncharacterized protein n=1 Tax=Luedemannella flava TaxID=349316 RepID=A0ABP4XMV7_9ACTN